MITDELTYRIRQSFGFEPTSEQQRAIDVFAGFLTDHDPQTAMILRGSAGTGKTTLAAAIVRALLSLKQKLVLLAPTGRAAKVFALHAGMPAYTIHRRIYRQQTAGLLPSLSASEGSSQASFNLNNNLHHDTLFIVDEASMISTSTLDGTFGSGCLLDDLISYVYQGQNCRLLLIGDRAQLPPVGEEEAPALMPGVVGAYGLSVYEADLNEVLRQSQQSGILYNATIVRQMITHDEMTQLPKIRFRGFPDIISMPGDELIDALATSYRQVGEDETMVVTRSNKRANIYNLGIRNTVLDREEELCRGDKLMIVKNNYAWLKPEAEGAKDSAKADGADATPIDFLANGDHCIVRRVRNFRELYGFRFADITIQLPDYDDYELTATAILDTLQSEAPALTREQQGQLYNKVLDDYADLSLKGERIKAMKADPYYNALQIKYGYAVTCHKAQGGQWAHVYIDQGYMTDDMLTPDYIHWLYTALTRATEKVFLVNWPATQTASEG